MDHSTRIPTPSENSPSAGSHGTVVFENAWEPTDNGVISLLAGLFFTIGGGLILLLAMFQFGMVDSSLPLPVLWLRLGSVSVVAAAVGVGMMMLAQRRKGIFRCAENTVSLATRSGEHSLEISELASFTFNATTHFESGSVRTHNYTHTSYELRFQPLKNQAGRPMKVLFKFDRSRSAAKIAAIETLRDHVSGILTNRMLAEVHAGKIVEWAPRIAFTQSGLEIGRRDGSSPSPAPNLIAYDEVAGFDIHQGTFYLKVKGREKPALAILTKNPNFYPGFLLLLSLGDQVQQVQIKKTWWERLMEIENSFKLTK